MSNYNLSIRIMEIIIIIILVVLVIGFVVNTVHTNRIANEVKNNQALNLMQQQIGNLTTQVNQQLQDINKQMQNTTGQIGDRLDKAATVIRDVQGGLVRVSEETKQIYEVGKDIGSLQDLLRAPKFRGGFGELFLGDLLSQILPSTHYEMQHKFRSGETVDAVIKLRDGLVPIDAKFPLENFKKLMESKTDEERKVNHKKFISDVKKHINDISTKYILPDEGTYDFALLYIPAENIYYETIIKDEQEKELYSYALEKRVMPVSPNSFYAYLQVIVLGLRGLRIEKSAQQILGNLARLQGDFTRFADDFKIVGKHLTDAKNKFDESTRRLEQFGDKLQFTSSQIPLEKKE